MNHATASTSGRQMCLTSNEANSIIFAQFQSNKKHLRFKKFTYLSKILHEL